MTSLLEALCTHPYVAVAGGGMRCMFLLGVLEHLSSRSEWDAFFEQLRGAAGTSSGALVALALVVGGDIQSLCDALIELSREHTSINPQLDVQMAFDTFGLDDGELLALLIHTVMDTLGLSKSATFASLRRLTSRDFRVCCTNLHTMSPVYLSCETAPSMPIRDAIYMSMCVPFLFKPKRIAGELYVDGGLLRNHPIDAFGPEVVPLLFTYDMSATEPPTSLRAYAVSVALATLHVQEDLLHKWKDAHPTSVITFTDAASRGSTSWIHSTTKALEAMRHRGFVEGLMSNREAVAQFVAAVVLFIVPSKCDAHECEVEPTM